MFSTFSLLPSETCAVQNMTVSYRSLISCCPGMLLRCFLNDFEVVPVARFTGIAFISIFHTCSVSVVKSLCFRIFSDYFFVTFLSSEIAVCINVGAPFSLSRTIMSGSLLRCFCQLALVSFRVSLLYFMNCYNNFSTSSYQCSLSNFTNISLRMLKCTWA
jgi:hypothetical protein